MSTNALPAAAPPASVRPVVPWLVGALALVLGYAALGLPGAVADVLVDEDGPYETVGAVGLLVAGVLFARAGVRGRRTPGSRARTLVLLGMGAALLLAAGEEISWGQRVLGLATPAEVSAVSTQDEINLHNLEPLQGKLDLAFQAFWMLGFLVLPIAAAASDGLRRRAGRVFPVVPVRLAVLFALVYLAAQVAEIAFGEAAYASQFPVEHSVTEVKEALAGVLLAVAAVVTTRSSDRDAAKAEPAAAQSSPGPGPRLS